MRTSIKAAVAGIAFAACGIGQVTGAMAAEGYTVVNTNGSSAIQAVWVAESGEPNTPWRPANMSYAIAPGTQSYFSWASTGGNCFYDVKVRFSDGNVQTFVNVNVCRGTRLIAA